MDSSIYVVLFCSFRLSGGLCDLRVCCSVRESINATDAAGKGVRPFSQGEELPLALAAGCIIAVILSSGYDTISPISRQGSIARAPTLPSLFNTIPFDLIEDLEHQVSCCIRLRIKVPAAHS